jgi:hypothetical protein
MCGHGEQAQGIKGEQMSEYPNLDALQRGGCGPTSDWIKVIPEVRAALGRIRDLKAQVERLKTGIDSALCLVVEGPEVMRYDHLRTAVEEVLSVALRAEDPKRPHHQMELPPERLSELDD